MVPYERSRVHAALQDELRREFRDRKRSKSVSTRRDEVHGATRAVSVMGSAGKHHLKSRKKREVSLSPTGFKRVTLPGKQDMDLFRNFEALKIHVCYMRIKQYLF